MRTNFFTNKQQWRRTLNRHQRIWGDSEFRDKHSISIDSNLSSKDSDADMSQTASPSDISVESMDQRGDFEYLHEGNGTRKSSFRGENKSATYTVSFNNDIQTCLVPSRKECGPQLKELYWHQEDYDLFKQDAVGEIRMYWRLSGTSAKEAIVALYQPEFDQDELVISVLYPNLQHSASNPALSSLPPSPLRYGQASDAHALEENHHHYHSQGHMNNNADMMLEEVNIAAGTVMRHVDSLSSLHHHGFETTDSESTIDCYSLSSSQNGGQGDLDYLYNQQQQQQLQMKQQQQQDQLQLQHHQLHMQHHHLPPPHHHQQQQQQHQRVAHGGVWIDSENDSDSLVSDSMDYDM